MAGGRTARYAVGEDCGYGGGADSGIDSGAAGGDATAGQAAGGFGGENHDSARLRAGAIGVVGVGGDCGDPDAAIFAAVEAFGGKAVLTSAAHPTGTDRLAEAARNLPDDVEIIVNVQGDEPLIDPETIDAVAAPLIADAFLVMASAMCPLPEEAWNDPARVKVVCDRNNFALYFSRHPIPYRRTPDAPVKPMLHLGLYAYRRDFLIAFAALPPTPLERTESLEQLRALEHGYRIRMVQTADAPLAIDTPEDLARVRALFERGNNE